MKIGLIGYFGWGNFGDELFVKVHKQQLSHFGTLEPIHEILADPYFTSPIKEIVEKYDAFIIGGGDLLNPVRMSPLYWKKEYLEKPVFITGLGVPNRKWNRKNILDKYRGFLQHDNVKLVISRDPESTSWINQNLEPKVEAKFFPDPVCALSRPLAKQSEEKLLGVVLRSHRSLSGDLSYLRKLVEKAKSYGYIIRHIVLGKDSIGQLDYEITKQFALPQEEIFYSESLDEQCVAIGECHALASIKFHGLIVATMYGVPTIALSTTPKNRNFLNMIERSDLLGGYNQENLHTRMFYYPARIHQSLRARLYRQARNGYNLLEEAIKNECL